jgi:hypothetical protein
MDLRPRGERNAAHSVPAKGFPLDDGIVGPGGLFSLDGLKAFNSPEAELLTTEDLGLYCNSSCKDIGAYRMGVDCSMMAFGG